MAGEEGNDSESVSKKAEQTLSTDEEVAGDVQGETIRKVVEPTSAVSNGGKTKLTSEDGISSNSSGRVNERHGNLQAPAAFRNPAQELRNIKMYSGGYEDDSEWNRHGRNHSLTPILSIDTQSSTIHPDPKPAEGERLPLSPSSPRSTAPAPTKKTIPKSPLSPRIRDRGFSLRRSLLARSMPGQQLTATGNVIELDPIEGSSSRQQSGEHHGKNETQGKKPTASVSVSPVTEYIQRDEIPPPLTKKAIGPISLPNYEDWAKKNSAPKRCFSKFKEVRESLRKTILRIHDLPPSKHGRHILMDVTRKKPLIDERRGHEYISNTIRSSRYTLYNFVPRQLFAQFSKLANFYFLCVSILQMIPGLSTTGTYTTIVPLLFFVTISIAKEGYDDLRRYRLDKAENRRTATVLHAYNPVEVATGEMETSTPVAIDGLRHWAQIKWQDVKVGDVIKLERDEAAPADLVILQAKGSEGAAYIETMALDGETNLKTKQPSPPLVRACQTHEDIVKCRAHIVVEDPNLDLYSFEGNVTVGEETLPLTNGEIIYRGSILRNTSEAIGMVIYTGEECKIRMNSNKNPRIKAPALQAVVNKVVIIIVIFVIALAIFNTAAYQIWSASTEDKAWYLTNADVAFFPIFTSFIILFNTMIPLSLYVSLEIVKLCQMLLMNDIEMYDEASDTPMEARTSTINEELGQVK